MFSDEQRVKIKQKLLDNPFSAIPPWDVQWMIDGFSSLPAGSNILEMGTLIGGTAVKLARALPTMRIHTIDLNDFETAFTEKNPMLVDLRRKLDSPELRLSDMLEIQQLQVEDFSNIVLYTGDSKSLTTIPFFGVLIDANHMYSDTLEDLDYAWNAVPEGGIIFGDDITHHNIYRAFVDFAIDKEIEIAFHGKCVRLIKKTVTSDQKWWTTTKFHMPRVSAHGNIIPTPLWY
jgi:predicted O-methyltransferase YrrM